MAPSERAKLRVPRPRVHDAVVDQNHGRAGAKLFDPDHASTVVSGAVEFEHVLVVGAGQMGGGIAQVVAASGRRVSLHDAQPGAVERGLETMRKSLEKLADKGGPDPGEVLARVHQVDGLVPADLLIEAVVENPEVKEVLFRRADATFPEGAILASNTSSIPITSLAAVTQRPERVIGMHFFNPVPVLKLVEVIRGLETSDATAAAITRLARNLGKEPAEARDFPGFVSNRILMPFINEAAQVLMEGVAEPEAIDTIARLGFAHPLGPLALADLIGLDTCVAIMEVLQHGLGDPKYAPCPLLRQYVQAGRLGRKSGRGFYEYG
jgi:3-hydroxybutyryl-CoA dehydrogenase